MAALWLLRSSHAWSASHRCGDSGATDPCGAEAVCADSHTLICDDFEDGNTTGWNLSGPFSNATDQAYAGTHSLKNSWAAGLNYSRGTIVTSGSTLFVRAYWRASDRFTFSGAGANPGSCTDPSQKKWLEINKEIPSEVCLGGSNSGHACSTNNDCPGGCCSGSYGSRNGIFLEPDDRCQRGLVTGRGKYATAVGAGSCGSDVTVNPWNMFPDGACTACPPGGHSNASHNATIYLNESTWHCVELGITQAGAGTATGAHVQYWLDDVLQVDVTDEQLGATSNYISLDGEHNGGVEQAQQEWWDNVVVSTQRVGCSTTPTDTTTPAQAQDLCVGTTAAGCTQTVVTSTTVPLKWTSAGDDGMVGLPSAYIVKDKVTAVGTSCGPFVEADWAAATTLPNPPTPVAGGNVVSMVAGAPPNPLLANKNHCFAVKTRDETGSTNESLISLSSALNQATTPPAGGGACGNGQVDPPNETCDTLGPVLNGQTCKTQGFPGGGPLLCTAGCATFDTTSCTPFASTTAIPVIWFLDVPSAPVGAYVAIRGKNFSDATGTVTVGGTTATIVSWSTDRIVITVPSKTTGASYPVVVTHAGIATAPVSLQVNATTATRYVNASGGSDTANTCASGASPCATISRALAQASAGDVILIRAGTYNETTGAGAAIIISTLSTSASAPLTLRGYPGETVVLGCNDACYTCTVGSPTCSGCTSGDVLKVNAPYVYLTNLSITGSREDGIQLRGDFARLADSRVFSNNTAACPDTGGGSGVTFEAVGTNIGHFASALGNDIYTNGSFAGDHGIYSRGANSTIAWNTIHGNVGDGLFMLGAGTGTQVISNVIYSNALNGIEITGANTDATLVNNIIYSNTQSGLKVNTSGGNLKIQNNTFNANGGTTYYQLDLAASSTSSSSVRSNIVAGGSNTALLASRASFTGSFASNLYYRANGGINFPFSVSGTGKSFTDWQTAVGESAAQFTAPNFVGSTDFHLQVSSLAINRSAAALFGYDFEGRPRPFASQSDTGASEYQPGTSVIVGGGVIRGARFAVSQ